MRAFSRYCRPFLEDRGTPGRACAYARGASMASVRRSRATFLLFITKVLATRAKPPQGGPNRGQPLGRKRPARREQGNAPRGAKSTTTFGSGARGFSRSRRSRRHRTSRAGASQRGAARWAGDARTSGPSLASYGPASRSWHPRPTSVARWGWRKPVASSVSTFPRAASGCKSPMRSSCVVVPP